MLSAKILFYGEVVDQHGEPVADAKVEYYYHDMKSIARGGSKGVVRTDADGKFTVRGVRGSSLSLVASKKGYDHTSDLGGGVGSARNFDFGFAPDGGRRYMDPALPSKLTLVKKGELEQTIHCERRYQPLSVNGPILRMYLDESGAGHAVDFQLDVDPDAQPLGGTKERYPWSVLIKAPQGQVAEQGGVGYVAPDGGYRPEVRLGYDASQLGEGWRSVVSPKTLFVRFDDGTHARLKFDLYSEMADEALYLESWFNPKPNSRQLAPGKEIKVRRQGVLLPQDATK